MVSANTGDSSSVSDADGRLPSSSASSSRCDTSRSSSPPTSDVSEPKANYPPCYPDIPEDKTPISTAEAVSAYCSRYTSLLKVYSQDLRTPDHWVHRNPELIRLTGKHPFNCEAPLTELFQSVSHSYREPSSQSHLLWR